MYFFVDATRRTRFISRVVRREKTWGPSASVGDLVSEGRREWTWTTRCSSFKWTPICLCAKKPLSLLLGSSCIMFTWKSREITAYKERKPKHNSCFHRLNMLIFEFKFGKKASFFSRFEKPIYNTCALYDIDSTLFETLSQSFASQHLRQLNTSVQID